eukprot:2969995-Amphidinium_carterae.1
MGIHVTLSTCDMYITTSWEESLFGSSFEELPCTIAPSPATKQLLAGFLDADLRPGRVLVLDASVYLRRIFKT